MAQRAPQQPQQHAAEVDLLPNNLLADEDDGAPPNPDLYQVGGQLGFDPHTGGLLQVQSQAQLHEEHGHMLHSFVSGAVEDIAREQGRAATAPCHLPASSPITPGQPGVQGSSGLDPSQLQGGGRGGDSSYPRDWYYRQQQQQQQQSEVELPQEPPQFDPWAMFNANIQQGGGERLRDGGIGNGTQMHHGGDPDAHHRQPEYFNAMAEGDQPGSVFVGRVDPPPDPAPPLHAPESQHMPPHQHFSTAGSQQPPPQHHPPQQTGSPPHMSTDHQHHGGPPHSQQHGGAPPSLPQYISNSSDSPQQQLRKCRECLHMTSSQQVQLQQQYQGLLAQQQHLLQSNAGQAALSNVAQQIHATVQHLNSLAQQHNTFLQHQQVLQQQLGLGPTGGPQQPSQPRPPQQGGPPQGAVPPGIAPSVITSGGVRGPPPRPMGPGGGPPLQPPQHHGPLGWMPGAGAPPSQPQHHQHHHHHQLHQVPHPHHQQAQQQQQQQQLQQQQQQRGRGTRRRDAEKTGSPLMEEFRQAKGRQWEISNLAGHIVEFSRDQDGSRLIQRKLEAAGQGRGALGGNSSLQSVFQELQPHALELMSDVFGNYVIQKLLEFGLDEHRIALARAMQGHVVNLTLQTYGCRVMQKALDVCPPQLRDALAAELDGHVPRCVTDQNGNHVIQKCIERLPNQTTFIATAFVGQIRSLGTHAYGCRVLQRILEHVRAHPHSQLAMATRPVVDEIIAELNSLVMDQNGNYVVQHVLLNGDVAQIQAIVNALRAKIVMLSQHKFASNVVEKVVECASPQERTDIVRLLINHSGTPDGTSALLVMIQNQFANYVVQKLFDLSDEQSRRAIVEHIRPHIPTLRRGSYGKHIISRIEKIDAQRGVACPPQMAPGALQLQAGAPGFVPHPTGPVLK
eukprot:TRINITY_DN4580_c0_g2_i1.p1 TRINITY_DN4580_c0_g2~~TRINITY_DN4580_c0_g2_i1.p1  ORF type:complete len:902 (+),score=276.81 TRINITY_DN4580_c0_g2_i1:79-2784(+)